MRNPLVVAAILLVGVIGGGIMVMSGGGSGDPAQAGVVKVTMPALSDEAKAGQKVFAAKCASCHGRNADGTKQGPPLIHKIYEPGHHGDYAFVMAPKQGVRAHHWPFGNMPPVPGVSDKDIQQIIRFVREVQRANGIE